MKRTTILLAAIALSGCVGAINTPAMVMNRAIDNTVDSATNKIGERIGEAIAADMLAKNPHLLQAYTMNVFNMMFYQGGYYLDAGQYQVGEWSAWECTGREEGDWFSRTLLRRLDDGKEWWRVETVSNGSDGKKETVIMEALFSAGEASGSRRILRLRTQLPHETEPNEVPITEADSQRWYFASGGKLTPESLDGMTVGEENVAVPAGTFMARHLSTKSVDDTRHDWWLNDAVPGQLVKFARTQPRSEELYYAIQLVDFGSGQSESKLGIDFDQPPAE